MNCRHCGSSRVRSEGRNVKCKDCGRASTKIQRSFAVPAEDRPLCPECGASNPYSNSSREGEKRWVCRECGRFYIRNSNKGKVELPIMEVQVE